MKPQTKRWKGMQGDRKEEPDLFQEFCERMAYDYRLSPAAARMRRQQCIAGDRNRPHRPLRW